MAKRPTEMQLRAQLVELSEALDKERMMLGANTAANAVGGAVSGVVDNRYPRPEWPVGVPSLVGAALVVGGFVAGKQPDEAWRVAAGPIAHLGAGMLAWEAGKLAYRAANTRPATVSGGGHSQHDYGEATGPMVGAGARGPASPAHLPSHAAHPAPAYAPAAPAMVQPARYATAADLEYLYAAIPGLT